MKRRKLTAIDVGTSKICCIMADTDAESNDLRIVGVGITESRGVEKGMVTNLDATKVDIKKAIKQAEQAAGYKAGNALVNVSGRNILSYNNRGVVAINNRKQIISEDDVDRVLDIVKNDGSEEDDEEIDILHLIPLSYAIDKQEGIKNPIGLHGFRLDVNAHIVKSPISPLENLTKSVKGAGLQTNQLIYSPLASSEAVLNEDERQSGVILADIGAGVTDVAIYKDGYIVATATIPVGGANITHDLAVGLKIPEDFAEYLKCKYVGVNITDESIFEQVIREEGYEIPYRDLYEITKARLDELMRLIMLELPEEIYSGIRAGIVLTGGTTNIPGIEYLAQSITRLPVRIGAPQEFVGLADILREPMCSTVVGLLLWELSAA